MTANAIFFGARYGVGPPKPRRCYPLAKNPRSKQTRNGTDGYLGNVGLMVFVLDRGAAEVQIEAYSRHRMASAINLDCLF